MLVAFMPVVVTMFMYKLVAQVLYLSLAYVRDDDGSFTNVFEFQQREIFTMVSPRCLRAHHPIYLPIKGRN